MAQLGVCTIVSNNYLAYARVFAESYRRHHPDVPVFACIVDTRHPAIDYASLPFTPIFAEELGIPAFANFAFRYDILELNTAVKPTLLAHLRDRHGLDRVYYFDPDILVMSPLRDLDRELAAHTMLLTPHITQPLDDEASPNERMLRMAGVYNLGFLGLHLDARTRGFLEWWTDRLARYCVSDPSHGLFVDQSWMDLAPSLLDGVRVLRDPIYNVAYWNLAHRHPRWHDGRWEIGGTPVGFVHFSGFDARNIDRVSKHHDRFTLFDRPELRPLFERYRELLLTAGHAEFQRIPYAYGTFTGGSIGVNWLARRILQRVDPHGRRWPDPFDPHRDDSFLQWLVEPRECRDGFLNRIVLGLWEERADLVSAFPDVCGNDLGRYVDWLVNHGEGARAGLHEVFTAGVRTRTGERASHVKFSYSLHPYDAAVADTGVDLFSRLDMQNPGSLTGWLNEPIPGCLHPRPVITRAALLLYKHRSDARARYADPLGRDQTAYAYWFVHHGGPELGLHPDLISPVLASLPLRTRLGHALRRPPAQSPASRVAAPAAATITPEVAAPAPQPTRPGQAAGEAGGVNVAGYFGMNTGVGQIGRGTLEALAHAGIPVARIGLDGDLRGRALRDRIYQSEGSPFAITLLHANADETPRALSLLPRTANQGAVTIGYWFWELQHFPLGFADRFSLLTEVWAPSRFCQKSFEAIATVPVRLVQPCVLPPQAPALPRESLGMEGGRFYFFFSFDTRSVVERKNPQAVLDAFLRMRRATRRDVGLLLKVNQADHDPQLVAQLRTAARGAPVLVHTDPLSRLQIEGLIATTDACVSLHRSEGLGLAPLEALYLGKPVVATDYGGLTDVLDESTGYPVAYDLVTLTRDYPPYPRGATWAAPRIEHAAEQMLRVVEDPEETARRTARGRARVAAVYGVEAASARFREELTRLQERK